MDWILALSGGVLLTLMIQFNGVMAKYSTPYFASWMAHGIGTVASILFAVLISFIFRVKRSPNPNQTHIPVWAYLGGIAGSWTVILAAITVNSVLGLAPTLALGLVGQVIFSLVSDMFGLFEVPKRKFVTKDFFVLMSVLSGSGILLFVRT